MTILERNPEQISPQTQVNVRDLGERILKVKEGIDEALKSMRNDLSEKKKRKIEEIAVMCEESGRDEIIPFAELLRETQNINTKDDQGETLLINTLRFFSIKIMKLLLRHPDIKLNEPILNGETVLVFAAFLRIVDIVKFLLADSRLDLREYDQGKRSLMQTKSEEIRTPIKAKMREQGIEF